MGRLIFICFLLFIGCPTSSGVSDELIFWNVGQGLWTTLSSPGFCLHFDMGGEFFDREALRRECQRKKNYVVFSHWDWDHIGLARKAQAILPSLCVLRPPAGPPSAYKLAFLQKLPKCATVHVPAVELPTDSGAKSSNEFSRVFVAEGKVLLPGDSDQPEEKKWSLYLKNPERIRFLDLGHHGSRTATSNFLLDRLPNLREAIASARKSRYGHPHRETIERLKEHRVPLLTTEDWGTVRVTL